MKIGIIPRWFFKGFFELLVFINFGAFPKKTCTLPRVEGALTIYLMDSETYSIMRLESEFSAIAWDLDIF